MHEARSKNLDLGIFSSEEALSLHFSFKLHGILRPGSLVILNVSLMRAHLGTSNFTTAIRDYTNVERNYVSNSAENGPAIARPAGPVPAPMHASGKKTVT